MQVKKAPKFIAVDGSRVENDSIHLLFIAEDGQHYAVELAPDVLAPVVTAIMGHATEIRSSLPHPEDFPTQAMQSKSMTVAMNEAGDLAWKLTLQSGLALVVQTPREQFHALDATIAEYRELLARRVQ